MVQRVVEGALPGGGTGIRVSRPGFNVLDPNLTGQQLSFDSRWPVAARVHMDGAVTATPSGNLNSYVTVGFGTTFASPPPVLVLSDGTSGFEPAGWKSVDANWGGTWQSTSNGVITHCRIWTDRVEFWRPRAGANRVYKYIVLRPF